MTGLHGCVIFSLLCAGISLSASSFPTVTTGCFNCHFPAEIYIYFPLFSTFNLILSATGTTGRDGRTTYWLYQLLPLVACFLLFCPGMM